MAGQGAPLRALEHVTAVRQRLDMVQPMLVSQARSAGASWAEIGRALGITRQAARERYGVTSQDRDDPEQMPLWSTEDVPPATP